MGRLKLSFGNYLQGNPQLVLVTNIINVDDERKSKRNLAISTAESQDILLDSGQYIVEVILPSGQVINYEIKVEDQFDDKEIIMHAGSPHEWLGWQQLLGNTEGYMYLQSSGETRLQQVVGTVEVDTPVVEREVFLVKTLYSIPSPESTLQRAIDSGSWSDLAGRGYYFLIPDARKISDFNNYIHSESNQPEVYDRYHQLHEVGSFGNNAVGRISLFVQGQDIPTQYCTLPVPWKQRNGEATQIDALIFREKLDDKIADAGFRLSLVVQDRDFGTLLGYMGSGELSLARMVLSNIAQDADTTIDDLAMEFLYDKRKNPFAAAAGAYILLARESIMDYSERKKEQNERNRPLWKKWISNLMNWFQWLPDGPVLYAWMIMNDPELDIPRKHDKRTLRNILSDNEREAARRSLLECVNRGLPYYSRGVRILLDGLVLFANDARIAGEADLEIESALKIVWELASRINMKQLFTTVLLDR